MFEFAPRTGTSVAPAIAAETVRLVETKKNVPHEFLDSLIFLYFSLPLSLFTLSICFCIEFSTHLTYPDACCFGFFIISPARTFELLYVLSDAPDNTPVKLFCKFRNCFNKGESVSYTHLTLPTKA